MTVVLIVVLCLFAWWRMTMHWAMWLEVDAVSDDAFDWFMMALLGLVACALYPAVLAYYVLRRVVRLLPRATKARATRVLMTPPGHLTPDFLVESRSDRQARRIEALERRNRELERELGL